VHPVLLATATLSWKDLPRAGLESLAPHRYPRRLSQAANDARTSYLIAFDPPLDKWDGEYHKLRVEWRKGVRVLTKQGYYAFAGDAHEGDQEKAAIGTAISSPFDIPEIGLHAAI
jgi:hypothetical protein